jgi:hypothetical protein
MFLPTLDVKKFKNNQSTFQQIKGESKKFMRALFFSVKHANYSGYKTGTSA